MTKPFLGTYSDKEIKWYENKYCKLCKGKGLFAHILTENPYPKVIPAPENAIFIDAYWCPHCNKPLYPHETEGEPT